MAGHQDRWFADGPVPTLWRRAGDGLARLSLRARLLIGVLVLVAVGLVVADVATATALRSYLIGRTDQQLQAVSPNQIIRYIANNQGAPLTGFKVAGTAFYAALIGPNGQIAGAPFRIGQPSGSAPDIDPSLASGGGPLTVPSTDGHTPWRVLAVPVNGSGASALVMGLSLASVRATLARLELIEGLLIAAVLIMVGVVSRWVVQLGLRPLEEMGETAGAIAGGDLSRRVEPADEETEVGRLGIALNGMLAHIEDAFEVQRQSEERLRRFTADAAHELRTPLTSIRGYAELFRRGAGDRPEDLATAMRRIEQESIRMAGLVDDLLLLARLDQGRPLDRHPVDLARVAADAVVDARAVDPDRPITLDAPAPVPVAGDESRLRQVAANLLGNTRQHTPPRTPVRVSAWTAGQSAFLEVADEGPGLAPDDAKRVFERFYRADTSRSRNRGGAGLGLSIVSAITESHGGRVHLDTAPGAGAKFRVELPALTADRSDEGARAMPSGGGEPQVAHEEATAHRVETLLSVPVSLPRSHK